MTRYEAMAQVSLNKLLAFEGLERSSPLKDASAVFKPGLGRIVTSFV